MEPPPDEHNTEHISETDAAQLAQRYSEELSNQDEQNPNVIVLFSGVPGSGKSFIAQAMEQTCAGVRISSDEIRNLIRTSLADLSAHQLEESRQMVLEAVLNNLLARPNGLIIVDASCDRTYPFYAAWANEHGYATCIFRLSMPRELIIQRLSIREGEEALSGWLEHLDGWWQQWQAFGTAHTADMVITPAQPASDAVAYLQQTLASAKSS